MFEHTHTQKQARIFTPQWGFAVRGGLSGRVQIVMFEHIHEETETQLPPKGGGGGGGAFLRTVRRLVPPGVLYTQRRGLQELRSLCLNTHRRARFCAPHGGSTLRQPPEVLQS